MSIDPDQLFDEYGKFIRVVDLDTLSKIVDKADATILLKYRAKEKTTILNTLQKCSNPLRVYQKITSHILNEWYSKLKSGQRCEPICVDGRWASLPIVTEEKKDSSDEERMSAFWATDNLFQTNIADAVAYNNTVQQHMRKYNWELCYIITKLKQKLGNATFPFPSNNNVALAIFQGRATYNTLLNDPSLLEFI